MKNVLSMVRWLVMDVRNKCMEFLGQDFSLVLSIPNLLARAPRNPPLFLFLSFRWQCLWGVQYFLPRTGLQTRSAHLLRRFTRSREASVGLSAGTPDVLRDKSVPSKKRPSTFI
jgi:hypothetical protein